MKEVVFEAENGMIADRYNRRVRYSRLDIYTINYVSEVNRDGRVKLALNEACRDTSTMSATQQAKVYKKVKQTKPSQILDNVRAEVVIEDPDQVIYK